MWLLDTADFCYCSERMHTKNMTTSLKFTKKRHENQDFCTNVLQIDVFII